MWSTSDGSYLYLLMLAGYLDDEEGIRTSPYKNWKLFQNSKTKTHFCPDYVSPLAAPNTDGFNIPAAGSYHFGLNMGCYYAAFPSLIPRKYFSMPESTLWFADAVNRYVSIQADGPGYAVALRHKNGANVDFLDGHGEFLGRQRFGTAYADFPILYGVGYPTPIP